ncbi:hypothetical protein F2P81_025340 [Scophthalmus maximus]|uniref:Uncharacterized protein n=1 Tax=Scophthalmus maximus TaxID=52904 RepID=A0A6A4RQ27_SCOMX|nr:hypothetical protein F2P81_025340 [Scophthalmus maximus]
MTNDLRWNHIDRVQLPSHRCLLLLLHTQCNFSSGPRFHADGVREPSRTTRPPAAFESDEVIYIHGCCLFESTQRGECEVPAAERRNHRRRFLRSDRGERLFREEDKSSSFLEPQLQNCTTSRMTYVNFKNNCFSKVSIAVDWGR